VEEDDDEEEEPDAFTSSLPADVLVSLSILLCFSCIRRSVALIAFEVQLLCNRAPEILHEDHHQWVKAKIDGKTCLTSSSWVIVLYYGTVISVWTSRSPIILMFSWFSVD